MARVWLDEILSVPNAVGVLLGFTGIMVIGLRNISSATQVISVTWGLGAGLSWSIGTIVYKKHSVGTDPLTTWELSSRLAE